MDKKKIMGREAMIAYRDMTVELSDSVYNFFAQNFFALKKNVADNSFYDSYPFWFYVFFYVVEFKIVFK